MLQSSKAIGGIMVTNVVLRPQPSPQPLPERQAVPTSSWTPHRQPQLPQRRSLTPATNGKLEKFRQQPLTLEQLKRSQPSVNHKRLSHRLYVNGIALPALRVGALAVVFRADCQGFQLYSWGLRSPLSSLLFETFEYCSEAAVELGQTFDVDDVLRLKPFGVMETLGEMLLVHQLREQTAVEQG